MGVDTGPISHTHHPLNASASSSSIRNIMSVSTSTSTTTPAAAANGTGTGTGAGPTSATSRNQDESAFWIPQATPDGRLFYYNTLTGVSTLELPVESSGGGGGGGASGTEVGPKDRSNVYIPDITQPPPELVTASGADGAATVSPNKDIRALTGATTVICQC